MAMSNKLVTAYDMIKARDETIDELSAEVERLTPYVVVAEWTKARAEAAERRVAELEARLADEWRPVTGKVPRLNEKILLITDYTEPSISLVHRERHADHNGDVWRQYNGGLFKLNIPERALWRPLPPPPAATE
jgi:hypothetical protein